MVTRHRINLSFSEVEYQQLSAIAASRGKTPTTLIADLIRVMLHSSVRQDHPASVADSSLKDFFEK